MRWALPILYNLLKRPNLSFRSGVGDGEVYLLY